jgi:hypothetical protein
LQKAGSVIGAPRAQEEIGKAFALMSAIGRSWRRDIGGKQVDRAAVKKLASAVRSKTKAMLLTDGPGAGKTCVLLSAVETLEADPSVATLFLLAREFADSKSQAGRLARGLAGEIPSLVSRMTSAAKKRCPNDSILEAPGTGSPGQEPPVRNGRFGEVRSIVSTGLGSDPCLNTSAQIMASARSGTCGKPLARNFIFTRILFDLVILPG